MYCIGRRLAFIVGSCFGSKPFGPNLQPLPGSKQLAAMIGTTTMAAAPTYAAAPVQYAQYAQYADAPVQYASQFNIALIQF